MMNIVSKGGRVAPLEAETRGTESYQYLGTIPGDPQGFRVEIHYDPNLEQVRLEVIKFDRVYVDQPRTLQKQATTTPLPSVLRELGLTLGNKSPFRAETHEDPRGDGVWVSIIERDKIFTDTPFQRFGPFDLAAEEG